MLVHTDTKKIQINSVLAAVHAWHIPCRKVTRKRLIVNLEIEKNLLLFIPKGITAGYRANKSYSLWGFVAKILFLK